MSIINLTDSAAIKLEEVLKSETEPNLKLRITVMAGGCSGLQYDLYFDNKVNDFDEVIPFGNVDVVVDNKSATLLSGSTIDYSDGLVDAGFKIENPNATSSCGCGKSFC